MTTSTVLRSAAIASAAVVPQPNELARVTPGELAELIGRQSAGKA